MIMRPHPIAILSAILLACTATAQAAEVTAVTQRPAQWETAAPAPMLTVNGTALPRGTVEALPLKQTALETKWGLKGTFHGIALTDLLAAHGLGRTATVRVTAVDGYAVTLTRAEITKAAPLLASRLDGKPLGDGTMGPFILLWPATAEAVLAGRAPLDNWVWGVTSITAAP